MLLISTIKQTQRAALKPVRCPHCQRGRLCDTSIVPRKPKAMELENYSTIRIVLKCPICGTPVSLTIE